MELTYAQAVTFAPPNCFLASADPDFEERRLIEFSLTLEGGLRRGFIGAYKDLQEAFEDSAEEDIEKRRQGWMFLDGVLVGDDLWNLNQPELIVSTNLSDIPSVGVFTGFGLDAVSLTAVEDGAYYKCCYDVSCYQTYSHPDILDNALVQGVLA